MTKRGAGVVDVDEYPDLEGAAVHVLGRHMAALCGATVDSEPGGKLWLGSPDEVTCTSCLRLARAEQERRPLRELLELPALGDGFVYDQCPDALGDLGCCNAACNGELATSDCPCCRGTCDGRTRTRAVH